MIEKGTLIKPAKLKKGDTIGLVSPSSGLWEKSVIWSTIENIEEKGYKVKLADNIYSNTFYLAGSDEERAQALMKMFKDDSVDALLCTQGGYGSARIWKHLDFDVIKANPKIFVGYSDTTALHIAIHQKTGLVTFHGPDACDMSKKKKAEYNYKYLMKGLTTDEPIGEIEMAEEDKYLIKITGGEVTAPIIGGNITLLCGTLGTEYEVDTKGKILFIEEIDEEPWKIDHLLTHLYNAGKLHDAVGIVVGECVNCAPRKLEPGFYTERSVEDVIIDIIGSLGKPAIMNLPIGHTGNNPTVPIGVKGRLDGTKGKFEIIEKGVI